MKNDLVALCLSHKDSISLPLDEAINKVFGLAEESIILINVKTNQAIRELVRNPQRKIRFVLYNDQGKEIQDKLIVIDFDTPDERLFLLNYKNNKLRMISEILDTFGYRQAIEKIAKRYIR